MPRLDGRGVLRRLREANNWVHVLMLAQVLYRSERARGRPGYGLGLAMVRAIVGRHGGSMAVRSEVDRGTVVPLQAFDSVESIVGLLGKLGVRWREPVQGRCSPAQGGGALKRRLVRACRRWHCPPAFPILDHGDVHVWRIPLDVSPDAVADLAALLSNGERARAGQMLCQEAGRRFVLSHGALREILGRYLGQRPAQVRLVTDARGKLHLASQAGAPAICFSLSHSGELALCAVAKGRDVGVDVEQIRPVSAWGEIAARYFSQGEREVLNSLPQDRILEAFFRGWTH